jgi:hypothetical protein
MLPRARGASRPHAVCRASARSIVADRSKPGRIKPGMATNQEYRQDEENRDGKGFPV